MPGSYQARMDVDHVHHEVGVMSNIFTVDSMQSEADSDPELESDWGVLQSGDGVVLTMMRRR